MLVLLACAIEDSTDIFGISGGFEHPKLPPPGYATAGKEEYIVIWNVVVDVRKCNGGPIRCAFYLPEIWLFIWPEYG